MKLMLYLKLILLKNKQTAWILALMIIIQGDLAEEKDGKSILGVMAFFGNSMKKNNGCYTGSTTPKRIRSGGLYLRGLANVQRNSKETSQPWPLMTTVSDFTGLVIEPVTSLSSPQ